MGFLKFFSKSSSAAVRKLPSGTLTVDGNGRIVTCTVPSSYPKGLLHAIADEALHLFREARTAQLPLTELNIHFASLQITARELRGGAILFLAPKTTSFSNRPQTEKRI